jgi:hypothetical protein
MDSLAFCECFQRERPYFVGLFEPAIAMTSSTVALLLTYVAALHLVPLGLWAAQLVSCATFADILLSEVALMP